MKKILFLTASYPDTRRSASMLCTHRVMECVQASKRYEVHTLCLCYKGEKHDDIVNGIIVHRVTPSIWTRCLNSVVQTRKHHRIERILEVLQKTLTIPFFPITEPLTTFLYYKAAEHLHDSLCFDLIVSEHHTLLTLVTGCRLMHKTRVKHVAMLWDPIKGQIATSLLPKTFTDRRINRVEYYSASNTTLQISMKSMQSYHIAYGDIVADHRIYLDIPSILKPELETPTEYLNLLRKDCCNIVFSGLLSPIHRNPLPIINLLNQVNNANRINLVFFSMGADDILKEARDDFKGTIVLHDYIPLNELHTLYRHADYLLNVSHINANMIPSKIFEYMSYGKPVISTFITNGDSAEKYINRYPEGLCIDLNKSERENIDILNVFLNRNHCLVPFDVIKKLYIDNTPEKYLEVIDNL